MGRDYNFIIMQSLNIKTRIFNIIYDTHYRQLVGSRNIFVRELIARTDLSAGQRQTTRQNSAVLSELYREQVGGMFSRRIESRNVH